MDPRIEKYNSEPEKMDFEAHGLKCAMRRGGFGAWCGYVAVTKEHPLFGVGLDYIDVDVHGELTWADDIIKDDEKKGLWWFGFDCAHAFDFVPELQSFNQDNNSYKDAEFVKAECEKLAKQLSNWRA